jgi:hypothetical protein
MFHSQPDVQKIDLTSIPKFVTEITHINEAIEFSKGYYMMEATK